MVDKTMTAAAFRAWREDQGLSERAASETLGMSRDFLRRCEREGAPLYIALACAAVKYGVPPLLHRAAASEEVPPIKQKRLRQILRK